MKEKTKCILVVDDDPLVLWLVDHALSSDGFRVITAEDGIEALKRIAECRTSVVMALIDVMMPRMNGKELARELLASCPGIKILFMSGYGPDILADEPALAEKSSFLEKPFDFSRLLKKVHAEMADSPGTSIDG